MATLYGNLLKALKSYDDKPEGIITQQAIHESLYMIRGRDRGIPAWHYILVPANKLAHLKAQQIHTDLTVTDFGRFIQYRNKSGITLQMSGWGRDPSKMIKTWIDEHYAGASVDENINLIYEEDDIRLCTMQRAIPEQLLGYHRCHQRQKLFHYIELIENLPSTLAIRAGIKNYDRIICFNGVNVENHTPDQFDQLYESERHLPVQILVCSPATYAHYKDNNKSIHSDLSTVQRLKPVYATSTSDSNTDTPVIVVDDNIFCTVQWENSSIISIVSQSAIFKSPEFTRVNDVCFVETEGQYEKGKILFIGSYNDCENLKAVSILETHAHQGFLDTPTNSTSDFIDSGCVSTADILPEHGTLEQLPNELFLYLFNHLTIQHLYNAFWGLNARFNSLFQSYENLCLTFDDKTDQLSMKSYAPFVTRLIIDTSNNCDFRQFLHLQTLIVCDGNSKHLEQIQPDIVPNLTHLSFLLGSEFIPSFQLINNVFSNRFPSLRHANLGRINDLTSCAWSTSPSLRFVSIRCDEPLIVSSFLASCPNLDHLQVHVLNTIRIGAFSSPPPNHPLRRFTLWSRFVELTPTNIDTILANTPNVEHFYLQTICRIAFVDLAVGLINQLNRLSRFDCYITENMSKEARIGDVTTIHQLHPCFNRVKCIKEEHNFRIFATQ